jgi:hypothetical protein
MYILKKPIIPKLLKKFSAFYGTHRFIANFTKSLKQEFLTLEVSIFVLSE